ncbi:Beta-lactamase hydrolase-family protein [Gloeocapsa sp. PCC 7428]|uniref:protein tyrosine phosphatase family protein n=1 Tax=Gloeocapsa sp. PCC 7428 TaxID=1173026 RepID=UPI0002A5C159|nr:protein tyrosine phosphatase family protein [Gloeocapsa sp. PCC 7428]AFZ32771.1 Beta-lactamase hydrolase-family protein [Gloeocapsa sp. PCC 7428]
MEIYNFLQVSDAIATAGQPTAQQFADIKAAGYEVVVNLALPTSTHAIANEQKIVEDLGMDYVHIPVIWEKPTLEDIERFFHVMQANADKNVFVHCAMNMRVSAFVYLYRVIHEQTSVEEAKQDLQRIWQPNDTWQQFIDKVIAHYQKA